MEELKMILEVVKQAGEGAYTIAIIYFIRGFLSDMLTFIGIMIPVFFGFKFGVRAFKTYNRAYQVCDMLGLPHPSYDHHWQDVIMKLKETMKGAE